MLLFYLILEFPYPPRLHHTGLTTKKLLSLPRRNSTDTKLTFADSVRPLQRKLQVQKSKPDTRSAERGIC